MLSVKEALSIIKDNQYCAAPVEVAIENCLNLILAENVFSAIDMPPFRQSAMDGYAVCIHNNNAYKLIGEIKAGDDPSPVSLKPGEAIRIFTGAAIPNTANAVIMQEKVTVEANVITLEETPVKHNNIRSKGEQIKQGEIAIKKDTLLTPTVISFLASLGFAKLQVYPKPKVGIIVTGSELVNPGMPLPNGKIYESNSILLSTSLQNEGIDLLSIYKVVDNYNETVDILKKVISENDFVLISGGISVGDYDFTGKALEELNTKKLFYKIKQKPGKPLYFGKNNNTYIFALPGNPASALTCFYLYAIPMLRYFSGKKENNLKRVSKKLEHDYIVKGIRAQFLKAQYKNDAVSVLGAQSSAMIHGFNDANCLIVIPENSTEIKKYSEVEVIVLP